MTGKIDLVLAPVDGSHNAESAVEYGLAIATQYEADLHLLHLLDQRSAQKLEDEAISADTVADEQRSFTRLVRQKSPESANTSVSHSSAFGFSRTQLSQTPGTVILDTAEELDADFLVVPRVTASGSTDEVLGEATLHVLEYASQPVLSV